MIDEEEIEALRQKIAKLDKRLRPEDLTRLLSKQRSGGELSRICLGGGGMNIEERVDKWEQETAKALREMLGEAFEGRFLHAPVVPVQLHGHQPSIMMLAGREQARMSVLNEIVREQTGQISQRAT